MNTNDSLDEGLVAFTEESAELLELAENTLLQLENNPEDEELISELFRSVHTIKGSSGIFGFNDVVNFTHIAESVMGKARDNELTLNDTLISTLLDATDHISTLIEAALTGQTLSDDVRTKGDELLRRLSQYLDSEQTVNTEAPTAENTTTVTDNYDTATVGEALENSYWHISLRFEHSVLQNGMDPISFLRYLSTVGDIIKTSTLTNALPSLEELNPENCYLGFEIDLESNATKNEIEAVFEFVQDDCQIHILPPNSRIADFSKAINDLPEENALIGEILINSGCLTPHELEAILTEQSELKENVQDADSTTSTPVAAVGELAVNNGMIQQTVVDKALEKQTKVKEKAIQQKQSIRIDPQKLGHLINLVGELVIGSAHIKSLAQTKGDESLIESTEKITHLVDEIRGVSLGLRMVQIGDTFNRYKRTVRDLCKTLGKKVDLQLLGGDTELDKRVIEKISDPLMHMVRNSVDHGIETPAQRLESGKPEVARLTLNAFHESGSIVIEISDDGAGLNRDRILEKAMDKGLVSDKQALSDDEIYALIFEAGFSTAESLSNVSGRGVGMDVVRSNIEELRGHIKVKSTPGVGCCFMISLPLTLAIIDGFQVNVGQSSYIIPLGMVDECIELDEKLTEANSNGNYVNLRGEVLPYVRLGEIFEEPKDSHASHRDNIVVVHCAGQKTGLVVDELLGEQQAVIKPLGKVFQNLKYFSGATILGGGDVAMILDVPQLVHSLTSDQSTTNWRPH